MIGLERGAFTETGVKGMEGWRDVEISEDKKMD